MQDNYSVGKNPRLWVAGAFAAIMIVLGTPGAALAQLKIAGDIGFGGVFTPADSSFASASLATATSLDYNGNSVKDTGAGVVLLGTGDFSSLFGTAATLYDFVFSPLAGSVNPLWQAGGFSFALNQININTQDSQTLSLSGTGFVSGNSFASTAGIWNFTGNSTGGSNFVFSAGVAAVPEPEIYAMMGVGMGIMGWVARRKKRHPAVV